MMIAKYMRESVLVPYNPPDIYKRKCGENLPPRIRYEQKWEKHACTLKWTFESVTHVCVGKHGIFVDMVLGVILPQVFGV
jgi:hypothetical protein